MARKGKTAAGRIKEAERHTRAVEVVDLAARGYTYQAIADALGVSYATARQDIVKTVESVEEFRQEIGANYINVQLGALDEMIIEWRTKAKWDKDFAALYLKALEQRAKLLGLGQQENDSKPSAPIILGWQGAGTLSVSQGKTSVQISGMEAQPGNAGDSGDTSGNVGEGHMSQTRAAPSASDQPNVISGHARPTDGAIDPAE